MHCQLPTRMGSISRETKEFFAAGLTKEDIRLFIESVGSLMESRWWCKLLDAVTIEVSFSLHAETLACMVSSHFPLTIFGVKRSKLLENPGSTRSYCNRFPRSAFLLQFGSSRNVELLEVDNVLPFFRSEPHGNKFELLSFQSL